MNSLKDRTFPVGALLAAAGGVAAVCGAVTTWWEKEGGILGISAAKAAGWDLDGGRIAAILGIVAVLLALMWVLHLERPLPPFRASGSVIPSVEALIVLVGVCLLVVVGVNYGDVSDATIAIGFWLDLIAGAAVTIGGVLGLMAGKDQA